MVTLRGNYTSQTEGLKITHNLCRKRFKVHSMTGYSIYE
jgi:hypothetical protein